MGGSGAKSGQKSKKTNTNVALKKDRAAGGGSDWEIDYNTKKTLNNGYTVASRKAPYQYFVDIYDKQGNLTATYTRSSDHITQISTYTSYSEMSVERRFKNENELLKWHGWD